MPYQLEIHLPDNDVETIDIVGSSVLGSSEQAELCIQDYDLPPKLCRFRIAQGVLTVINLGGQKPPLKIGKQKIERGKMYILDDEDILSFGDLKMIVHELGALDDREEEDQHFEPETPEGESSAPEFDSSAELFSDSSDQDDENEEDEAAGPTSLSVTQVLKQGKEEAVDQEAEPKKPEAQKAPEETPSRLLEITRKMQAALGIKQAGKGPVKAVTPEIFSAKNAKQAKAKMTLGWPNIVPRLLAFFLEMGGCILLATPLSQNAEILSQWRQLLEKIDQLALQRPQLEILSEVMSLLELQGFMAALLYMFLQIFVGFILGRSLGYVFMGINEDSGFITKRIKTLFRSLIFFLTGPLLIFDLPILIRKRSFKEWLTRSALYRPSNWPGVLSSILLFPPLILGLLLTSAVTQEDRVSLEFKQLQLEEVSSRLIFESLELRFPESALQDHQTLPLIEAEQLGLWLFNRGRDESPISVKRGPEYSLDSWTHGLLDNDFSLSFINEELHRLLETASTPGPLSPDQRQKLEQLFKDSLSPLELNFQSSLRLLQTYGPDLTILKMFSKNVQNSLSIPKEATWQWMNFLQRDVLWIETTQGETFEVQLIFLDTNPFKSLRASMSLDEKDKAREVIQESLLQVMPILPGPSPKGEDLEELSHRITDRSLQLSLGASPSAEELDTLYDDFFQWTGELMGGDSDDYQERFESQMELLLEKLDSRENKTPELQNFQENLNKLFSAYQNKKSSFFIEEETDSIDNAQNTGDDI